ncbi:MAG: protein of unknown function containing DUF4342 domain [Bacteroidetes bacterium HLUCCA01]|nr:MAG: protein of unknown function containing DUF4342 domain [Bacteroidetes bacterium HLUCCA01]
MGKTIFEEIIVTGEDLLRQVKDLIRKGNIRRLMIKNNRGHVLLETSLTMGAAGIGGFILLAPFLSAVAFVALMVTEARIVVERDPSVDDKEVEAENIEVVDG